MKVIFLNAPPQAGKDTSAEILLKHFRDSVHYHVIHLKFATPLKKAAHALFGLWYEPDDSYESVKGTPNKEFSGYTPREIYIALSEEFAKPKFGSDIFGKIFLNQILSYRQIYREVCKKDSREILVVCSDCGFYEEIWPTVDRFSPANCLLIRLHRNGCDFAHDSRRYLEGELGGMRSVDITNNSTYHQLSEKLTREIKKFL